LRPTSPPRSRPAPGRSSWAPRSPMRSRSPGGSRPPRRASLHGTMDDLPLIVDGDWLQARLDDPKLRLLDATTHLKFPGPDQVELKPGRDSYEREHTPGAVFADLLEDLADPDAPLPITVPS